MKFCIQEYKFKYKCKYTKIGYKIYGNKNKKVFIFLMV